MPIVFLKSVVTAVVYELSVRFSYEHVCELLRVIVGPYLVIIIIRPLTGCVKELITGPI